ncbi:YncE family protein, partial [Pinirhizobacter sp.]|uniref:YncE family protein n=1 Tax=Pinirhizobacter sp. TaxID=2950432 RepID=UPI002F3F0ADB
TAHWDYLTFDDVSRRLYVTSGDHVAVIDVDGGKQVGTVPNTAGVHGVALVPSLRRGFVSDGKSDSVTVFDTASLVTIGTIHLTGKKPDAILFDPASKHVMTFNGGSNTISVIDPATSTEVSTIDLPGSPEFAATDGDGHVFVNLEDRNALARIDTRSNRVDATFPLDGCEAPGGLAMDTQRHRVFSACQNNVMAITDAVSGKQVARVPIGDGPDAAGFDPATARIYSSNGKSGTVTVIERGKEDEYHVVRTVPTIKSARTMAIDHAHATVMVGGSDNGVFRILAVQ